MAVRLIVADVMDGLAQLGDDSVHSVVTSPPYWQLRDYGFASQIGMEPTPDSHCARLVEVFQAVRRVLRADGCLMLNYGDMWANDEKWGGSSGGKHAKGLHGETGVGRRKRNSGLKPKDLVMMPHRLALALQADGWWVRDCIIWHKPNPMPSSVIDRCTPAYEVIYHLSKSARYFWDAAAIAEPRTSDEDAATFRGGSYVGGEPGPRQVIGNKRIKVPGGWDTGAGGHGTRHRNGRTVGEYVEARPPGTAPQSGLHKGRKNETVGDTGNAAKTRQTLGFQDRWDATEQSGLRNRRNVWTIATEPFKAAHFATFPTRLARICIEATCPRGGTVLDPFGGSGTVGLVADRTGRDAVLIEGNPEYAEMARVRIRDDAGLFAEVTA